MPVVIDPNLFSEYDEPSEPDYYSTRPMTEEEDKYTFRQSSQLSGQTGLIGYLRANFGRNGDEFYSSWEDWNSNLKTPDFKQEFDEVINSLREDGDILSGRAAMSRYCNDTPQSKMTTEPYFYGVRLDTDNYAYLLRLNPNKGDYNLYCYCYEKELLNNHIAKARHGIRFIDSEYNEKFRIPDGGKIVITTPWGEEFQHSCRYVDETHLELSSSRGSGISHILEFAELCERNGNTVKPAESPTAPSSETQHLKDKEAIENGKKI